MREGSGSISVHLSSHEGNFKKLYASVYGSQGFLANEKYPKPTGTLRGYSSSLFLRADWPTLVTRYDLAQVLSEVRMPMGVQTDKLFTEDERNLHLHVNFCLKKTR